MSKFGVPLSQEKTEGPATRLSFLGIELDSIAMIFCLPADKLTKLKELVTSFLQVKSGTLKPMHSLLGLLVFARRAKPTGRVFSRRLSLYTMGVTRPELHIRMTRSLKADLGVWDSFLHRYNDRTCCQAVEMDNQVLELYTDAAGSLGFGAIFRPEWCAEEWPVAWRDSELC